MRTATVCSFPSIALCILLLACPSFLYAGKTPLRLKSGKQTSTLTGYDSSGVIYVSVNELAARLSVPVRGNPERRKIELRLPEHSVKVTAHNPFLTITSTGTGISSSYQFCNNVLVIDSNYYAPATDFLEFLERLHPTGAVLQAGNSQITSERSREKGQFDITGLSLEPYSNGYLLTIKSGRKLGESQAILAKDGWLYLTISNAVADTVSLSRFKTGDIIRRFQVYQDPTSVQLNFKVSPDINKIDPIVDQGSNDLLIALHSIAATKQAEREKNMQKEMIGKLDNARKEAGLDVIVIDAGHGGKDPGTIGVAGTREKDVTLGVALKLGKLIEENLPSVKVVYTRKTDVFVELGERAKIANRANGKLFISIHCNSTERKPSSANGFEIYIIRPERTGTAIRSAENSLVAERENKVIEYEEGFASRYQEVTNEESFILMTMRQSAFVRHSEEFAEKASDAMAKLLKIQNSGVRQAGFYVLVYAAMPNVLVETGYLSNRAEERVLRSTDGQRRIAEALFNGIMKFKSTYEDALNEGKPEQLEGN